MTSATRPIYRPEAVRRYVEGREKAVLPRFVSPRTFLFLWILLGLLAVGTGLAWSARVPVYAAGSAVVVQSSRASQSLPDDVVLAAFLPPDDLPRLRAGQTMFVDVGPAGERMRTPIVTVQPEISGPDAAQRRFGLGPQAAVAITQPSAVAIARFQPVATGLPPDRYVGSTYHVQVEVGSQRVLSLLPLVGRLVGD